MSYEIPQGRIKPKREPTFGKVKKPFKGKDKNRKGNKKESIFDHDRIKPKPSMKNDNFATPEERDYLQWLQLLDVPCFCCGEYGNGTEWHHTKEYSSDKKNHTSLIPLCGDKCHRNGTELSAHGTPKKFREAFPIELQREAASKFYNKYLKEKTK